MPSINTFNTNSNSYPRKSIPILNQYQYHQHPITVNTNTTKTQCVQYHNTSSKPILQNQLFNTSFGFGACLGEINGEAECDATLQAESSDDPIDTEAESSDDDIDEIINAYDFNNQTKLFTGSPVSVREACFIIIKLSRRLNLDRNGILRLLHDTRDLFPSDVKLPRTAEGLLKVIGM